MFKQIFAIVVLSILLGLGARVIQEQPVPFWGYPAPVKLIPPKAESKGAAKIQSDDAFPPADQPYAIDYSTAMGLFAKKKRENIHFVDSRDPELFAEGHIPGAVNIPYEELADYINRLDAIPKGEVIVFYCDGGDCHLSHDIAEIALSQGWRRTCVYVGGWEEWCQESDFIAKSDVESGNDE